MPVGGTQYPEVPCPCALDRMIQIDAAIRAGGYPTVRTFMDHFEVGERTVRADLAFLRDRYQAPLRHDRRRGGYHYTNPTWSLPAIMVGEGELLAFFLSVELARHYLGTAFEQPLRRAITRLAVTLDQEVLVDLNQLTDHYTFQPAVTTTADPALLLILFDAVRDHHSLDILYFTASTGERHRRRIEPYHLYNARGSWQVIAFDHRRRDFRSFLVSRIEEWTLRERERFVRDPAFSPDAYLATGFWAERGDTPRDIAIRFAPRAAHYLRGRQWHPSQRIEEHPDGALTLHLRSGALGEIGRWILSYGEQAEVLTPAALREQLAATAAALARLYAATP